MFTRSPISQLKCYACDGELNDLEIKCYHDFDGMCEECYADAMETLYDSLGKTGDLDD